LGFLLVVVVVVVLVEGIIGVTGGVAVKGKR
jgi:hypothetical protein